MVKVERTGRAFKWRPGWATFGDDIVPGMMKARAGRRMAAAEGAGQTPVLALLEAKSAADIDVPAGVSPCLWQLGFSSAFLMKLFNALSFPVISC